MGAWLRPRWRKAALLAMLLGCPRKPATSRCQLSPPTAIANSPGLKFDGISLVRRENDLVAGWSGAGGAYVRALDPSGTPRAPARRVAEPCPGGIALAESRGAVYLACSRPTRIDDRGQLWLYTLNEGLAARTERELWQVGRDSEGVAMVARAGQLHLLFHSGRVGDHAVMRASLDLPAPALTPAQLPEPQRLSEPSRMAKSPGLYRFGTELYATWAETEVRFGAIQTQIRGARWDGKAVTMAETESLDATPLLASQGESLWLGYQAKAGRGTRDTLVLGGVTEALAPRSRPRAVGRASGERPALIACAENLLAGLPIERGSERYVAFHALDPQLRPLEENHQFYVSEREFTQVAGACAQGHLVALAAERKRPPRGGAELVSMRFGCATRRP